MRTAAVVMECNPFHAGHQYILNEAKRITECEALLVILSPDFVQRGESAVYPKEQRTEVLLKAGADLVLELPAAWACGSAEYFAAGAMGAAAKTGVVTDLVFGSETGDRNALLRAAAVLKEEPASYKEALRRALAAGLSFPAAMEQGLAASDALPPSGPNDTLALQYLRFLPEGIAFHPVPRIRTESASEIRRQMRGKICITPDDFSQALHYRLLQETDLTRYADVAEDLANRIENQLPDYRGFEDFVRRISSRNVTGTRVSRALLHILLQITDEDVSAWVAAGRIGYLRVLGIGKEGDSLLKEIRNKASVPLIMRPSALPAIAPEFSTLWALDCFASRLYDGTALWKFGADSESFPVFPGLNEAAKPILRL